ncbi:Pentatricopeptide repeat-containing protein [Glycine soja]|nr:Pentatricopeptide repeat-containing protein [Glycine soja]
MPQRNVFTWTTLISSHFRTGSLPKAFEMFNHICALNERPNEYTFSVLLRACATPSLWNVGLQIHGLLVRSGLERNKFSGSSIVYMYFNSGSNLGDACCAFHDLLERDLVAWNVMISGFARVGDFSMVHRLFSEMWGVEGLKPDDCTFVSLLKCCSSLKELKQIHGLASKFGAEVDVVVGNALVDLYGKHGDVSSCRKVFDSKKEKYNFVWSLIISGYSMNKGHSGYVEDTMHFFTLILNKYKIKPESEHYSCLVDAYGRAGRLEEAYQTVQKDGNESAWRTLLSACRNHNNKEIGEKCAMKMIELNSSDHAGYILLSGIYIGEGKWEEALKCRERMAKIHVKKDPGSSWLI